MAVEPIIIIIIIIIIITTSGILAVAGMFSVIVQNIF
jgi:hypothetical protein